MGNPFEWLRAMARRGDDDDDDLLGEAAYALGGLGHEPAGLVVAARRLLAHHRRHGGLWWVASHVLCAADSTAGARACRELLDNDRTVARLAGALPLQEEGEQLAVAGWSDAIQAALDERPDLDVLAVVDPDDWSVARRARQRAELVDTWELADRDVRVVLAATRALGPRHALVDVAFEDVRAEVGRADIWLVAPLARILPALLFDAMVRGLADDESIVTVELSAIDRGAGPQGVEPPAEVASHVNCPVAAELLRPLD
jgi:hypothetical protein